MVSLSSPTARIAAVLLLLLGVGACGSSEDPQAGSGADSQTTVTEARDTQPDASTTASFEIEVWADNWMAVYVDGELIGEDSVPITTERSFNSETFSFEASYPFTVGIEAKDYMETESGLEYIGEQKQQMGDGGLIAQITDTSTGEVVAVTNQEWSALVVQRAPLNPDCEKDPDPDETCQSESTEVPSDWADPDFDDSSWDHATEWTVTDVDPKDGYEEIDWDSGAALIWGSDLEADNTILLRLTVTAAQG